MSKIKKKRKEKRGSAVIEFVFGLLIFVLLFAFTVDMFNVIRKQHVVNSYASSISRTISTQGGIARTAPVNNTGRYMSSTAIYQKVTKDLDETAKIKDFEIVLSGYNTNNALQSKVTLTPNTDFRIDYGLRYQVEIEYDYKWTISSQIVPGLDRTFSKTITKNGVSEFQYTRN